MKFEVNDIVKHKYFSGFGKGRVTGESISDYNNRILIHVTWSDMAERKHYPDNIILANKIFHICGLICKCNAKEAITF